MTDSLPAFVSNLAEKVQRYTTEHPEASDVELSKNILDHSKPHGDARRKSPLLLGGFTVVLDSVHRTSSIVTAYTQTCIGSKYVE